METLIFLNQTMWENNTFFNIWKLRCGNWQKLNHFSRATWNLLKLYFHRNIRRYLKNHKIVQYLTSFQKPSPILIEVHLKILSWTDEKFNFKQSIRDHSFLFWIQSDLQIQLDQCHFCETFEGDQKILTPKFKRIVENLLGIYLNFKNFLIFQKIIKFFGFKVSI